MADNTSVLGQEPIVPENITAPTTEGVSTTNYNNLDLKSRFAKIKAMDEGLPSARTVDLPVSSQKLEKRLGEFTPVEGVDIMENIAQDQSGWEQLAYLPLRAAAKAATEALKLPGFITGAVEWASTGFDPKEYGNAFNNAWTIIIDNVNTDLQAKGLPVYTPQNVQDGDIFTKLASTSFWATEGADGVGFLVGMMAPGALLRWAKLGETFAGVSKIFTKAERLAMPGTELAAVAKSAKTAAKINEWSSAVVNTVYEAATEGQQVFNDYLKDNPDDVEGAGRAASKTFAINNAILIGPNILNQKWLYNGFKRAGAAATSEAVGKSGVAGILEKSIEITGKLGALKVPSFLEKTWDVTKTLGKGFASEGLWEEGMQYATSEGSKKGVEVTNPIELLQEYIRDITADTKGNTEMWSGIILGGIMGGGMSMYGGIKQANREQKLASQYHNLLSSGQLNYYKTYKDFAKVDDNGKPIILKSGEYDLDPQKVIEGGIKTLHSAALREDAESAFKKGDKEQYDLLSNIMHFDYMMPWLEIEGGLDLLKKHLKSIATVENEKDIETLGVDPKNVDQLHKTLISKAEKFQDILNKINDTHGLSFKVNLPDGATKDDLISFSNNVKNSKLSLKANMDYSSERIESIKSDLAMLGIVPKSMRIDSELIKELSDSYDELKKNKTIDKADAIQIERNIHSIERLVKLHGESAIELNDAYDNKKMQIAFNEKTAAKLIAQKKKDTTTPEAEAEKKVKQGFIKDQALQDLHTNNVKIEKFDDINSNIKIWDEDTQSTISIPGRARLVTTRGIVKITYKDAEEKEHTVLAAIGDGNLGGGLDLRIVDEQKDGTFKPNTTMVGMAFLNSANEIALRTDPNSRKVSKFTITKPIDTYKSADEIQKERQVQAVAQYYKERIESIEKNKVEKDEITRLSNELKSTKQELRDEMKEHSKDLIVAKKLEDGTIILGKRETKRVLKVYKHISDMQKIVAEKTDNLNKIKDHNRNARNTIAQFRKDIADLKNSESLALDDIRDIMNNSDEMLAIETGLITTIQGQIDNTNRLIRNSLIKMRVYRSQVAKLLNIDISDSALGTFGMASEEKNELIDRMLLDKINEIWDDSLIDTFISEARTITLKLINLRDQVSVLRDMVHDMEVSLAEHEELGDKYKKDYGTYKYRYQEIFRLYKKLVPKYFKEQDIYNESLVNGKLIEGENIIDPENDYEDTFKLGYWELDPRHPFTGLDSYLTITSNQDHAATNDDVMRWYVYVNYAYKDIETREHPRHALKTFTYSQIAKSDKAGLRADIKFYLGNGKYMSYDDIQKIKDVEEKRLAEISAADDIKVILVDFKDTNKIALFTKEGMPENKFNKGVVPIYSSLGLSTYAYKESGYERFSSKKWMEKYAQAKLKEDPSLSREELIQLASEAYDAELSKTKAEFEALRGTLDTGQEILNITGINRGVKIDSDLESELEEATVNDIDWGKMEFVVSSPIVNKVTGERGTITKEYNGNEYTLTAGFTYWLNGTDLEVIKPKTLGETNSVESIFKLFQAIAKGKKDSTAAVTYLEQALHMLYSTKSDTSKPHRLYFYKAYDKSGKVIEGKYSSVVFGEGEISMDDLANNKNVESFKEFLTTKYWNFDKRLINGISDFSEYIVNKDGNIEEKRWVAPGTKDKTGKVRSDKFVGGYQAFLFRGSDSNVTKGTVNLAPVVKQKGENKYKLAVLNPQYKNKSIRTTLRSEKKEKVKKDKTPKEKDVQVFDIILHTTEGDKEGQIGYNKKKNEIYDHNRGKADMILDTSKNKDTKEFNYPQQVAVLKKIKELLNSGKISDLNKFKIEGTDFSVTVAPSKVETIEVETISTKKTPGDQTIEAALKGKKSTPSVVITDAEKAWSKASDATKKEALEKAGNDLTKAKQEYLDGINAILGGRDDMSRPAREGVKPIVDYEVEKQQNIDWFKQKFPSIPVDILKGLVEGNLWGKFVRGSHVLLSDIAEVGTIHHEAFHVWNNLFNDPESRIRLYDEIRQRTGNANLSDIEAEEYLAEEFRDFMIMGSEYKFNKGEIEKKNFFQKIIDFFKKLLHIDITKANKGEIEQAFKTISEGTFTTPKFTTEKSFEKRIPGIDASKKLAYLKDINYRFFTVLMKDTESGGDIIFNVDQNTKDIYEKVFNSYSKEKEAFDLAGRTAPSYVNEILSNKDLFIHNHLLYLTKYNIDLTHTFLLEDISEDDFGRNKAEWIESNKTSIKDEMPTPIRLLIASLRTVNEKNEPVRSDYFTRSNVEYDKIVNLLHNNLSNITTAEGIMDKLNQLSGTNFALRNLYKSLGGDIASDKMTMTQFRLYEQFITSFSSNKADARLYTNNNDGSTTQSNLVTDTRKELIKGQWAEKAKVLAITKQSKFIKLIDGEYIVNKKALLADLKKNVRDFSILQGLGIDVSDSLKNSEEVKNYLSTLKQAIEAYPEEININALYDRDKIENQTELDKLSARQSALSQKDEDLIYYNAEGNMEWGINRDSHLTNVKNRLNEHAEKVRYAKKTDSKEPIVVDESLNNVKPYDSSDSTGNLFTNNSLYWEHISNGGTIEVLNLKGMRSQLGTGYDIDSLTPQDYHMLTFDLILNNIIPYRRAADRGVENGFYAMPTNYNMGAMTFIDTMSRYMYDEVVTSMALIIEDRFNDKNPTKKSYQFGSGLKNYSKNARSLRTFDFIYNKLFNEGSSIESIENFLKKSTIEDVNIEKIRSLADKYIKKYESVVHKSFSNFINETIKINKENLIYSGIIKNKKGRWSTPGINPITLSTFKLSREIDNAGLLSDGALNKLLLVHAYNFFVGVQEQHKVFIGDVAFFDDMKSSNKRTKSFNSTREKTPNDIKTLELLNTYLPKITGMPHTNIINQVTLDTIRDSADPSIVALYNEYKDMKVADGAQFGTLDFIRGLQGRRGLWNDNLERTYQYEMQMLIKRILDSDELSKLAPWATKDMINEDGIPRFKGEIIDPYDISAMGQITPIKTQGSGYMANEINVGASVIDKMAVEPIMPSELNDTKLKMLLTMMSNNIDSISDATTKKADTYVNDGSIDSGYIIDNNTLITKISYDDYGTQLDIQEKEKKKVTDSTQKLCIYTSNMFDKGKLLDEYKELEDIINERDDLLNESYSRGMEASYRELGLAKDPEKAFYSVKDQKVFRSKVYQLFIQKQLPDNIIDGLDEMLNSETKFIELFSDGDKVEQVLMAFVKNNALKRKVNGEMFVQVPSVMYSEDLSFYSLSEDGKTTNVAEVMVPIPEAWNVWVKKIGGINELNRMLKDGELDKELTEFIANRVPSADINTIDVFKIKKFIPTYFGARIVLPKAIVAKASSDYDVDKLTSYLNNFKIINGAPRYVKQSTSGSELENRYIDYVKAIIPKDAISKMMAKEEEGFNKIKEAKKETFGNIKDTYKQSISEIDNIKSNIKDAESQIEALFDTGHDMFRMYDRDIKQEYWNLRSDHIANNTDGLTQIMEYIELTNRLMKNFDTDNKLIAAGLLGVYEEEIIAITKLMGASPEVSKEIRSIIQEAKSAKETNIEYAKKYFTDIKHKILIRVYKDIATHNDIMSIDEFNTLPLYKQQSNKAIENRINEIHREVLLHPARFKYLIRPLTSDRLKGLSENIEKPLSYMDNIERKYGDEYWMTTQWWYNNMKADSFWGGKRVLSNTASNNTVNALKQRFPIEVTGALQNGTIFFHGQKPQNNENYVGGHRTDGVNDIADNHSQILVASVDVSTDDFITKLGINNDTLGVLLYLNTHGLESGTPLKTIVKFLTHPVINEFLHETSLAKSQFMQHNQYVFKNKNWFFDEIGSRSDIIKRILDISTAEYDRLMYAKTKYFDNTKKRYKYLTYKDLEKNDKQTRIQILDNFLTYQDTAWKIASLHSALRPYASNKFGKTLHGIENSIDKFATVTNRLVDPRDTIKKVMRFIKDLSDAIFSEEDINRYVDKSFLKGAQNIYNETLYMYGWLSLTSRYPNINDALRKYVFNNFVTKNQKDYEKAAKTAKNQFLSFIFTFYRDSAELKDKYSSLITGKNSIPVRLRNIKNKLSEKGLSNEALDALVPAIKEFSYDIGRARENDFLYPMDKRMDVSDQNTFTTALEELMNFKSDDTKLTEEVQQFAKDFFEASIYQNGFGNSPISYTKMLPNSSFIPLIDNVVKFFIDNHSGDMDKIIESFSHQFFRNNLSDGLIVERFNKPIADDGKTPGSIYDKYGIIGDGMVHKKSNAAKHEYIAVRYYKTTYAERMADRRSGRKSAMEYLLYRRTDKITKGGYVVYELIDKLGDGFRFREYYPTYNGQGIESVLGANKYEGIARSKKVTEQVKQSVKKTTGIADVLYQLEADNVKPDTDLDNKMRDYMDAMGVSYKAVDMIKDKFDTRIPAVAVSKFSEMTIEVIEGSRDVKTLPEETAHFYVKLLDENSGLYKSMFSNIVNYSVYNEVSKQYNERYKGDEKLIREEAIGKLIADRIVNGINTSLNTRQQEQTNNWWTKLWNTIKDIFNRTKSDPYTKAAYDILTRDVSKLTLDNIKTDTEVSDLYEMEKPLEDLWADLPFTAKGIYKYDYQRTIDAAEVAYNSYVNEFGDDNVTYIPITDDAYKVKIAIKKPRVNTNDEVIVRKEDDAMENMKELSKAPVSLSAEQLVINFDTYFPEQSHLENEEKENIMKAIEGGELIISCKF